MGQSIHSKGQPTYEQLQEIIRRKDLALREAYWSNTTIRSIAWLAFQARDSGSTEFSDEKYTEAASWTFKMIADQLDAAYGDLEEAHRVAHHAVLSGADAAEGRS